MLKRDTSQTIQFSISTQFSFIWPIDRALSGATTLGQSGLGSDGNEWVLSIPQSASIIGTSPSDCLVSNAGHLWVTGSYPTAEKQSMYSTAPAAGQWVGRIRVFITTTLPITWPSSSHKSKKNKQKTHITVYSLPSHFLLHFVSYDFFGLEWTIKTNDGSCGQNPQRRSIWCPLFL